MSIGNNINRYSNQSFENHDYLPQKLLIEDMDGGVLNFIKSLNLSIEDGNDTMVKVPVIFVTQERWAEFKNNWANLKDEGGEEITMPFMSLTRTSVKHQSNPIRRTIPNKKTFTFTRVPIFDGTLKGYELYKIPQPPRVDIGYELRFFSHYMQDTNKSYEKMLGDTFSDGQAYIKINGYDLLLNMQDPSEDNTVDDITSDRRFQIVYPLTLNGKIVDPTNFERVQTITKIQINITES
jgi:hypothetical protein